jgi:hypothetical protein
VDDWVALQLLMRKVIEAHFGSFGAHLQGH